MKSIFPLTFLAGGYFLFGFSPFFIGQMQDLSAFSMTFYRFSIASLGEFLLIFISLLLLFRKIKQSKEIPSLSFTFFVKQCLKDFFWPKKSKGVNPVKNLWYLLSTSFILVTISVPFLYLSYLLSGLVLTSIINNCFTILLIAFINWIRKEERMDLLKAIYLSLITAAIFTIAYSSQNAEIDTHISSTGIIVMIISVLSYTLFLIRVSADPVKKVVLLEDLPLSKPFQDEISKNTLFLRANLKLFTFHLVGSILIIPFSFIMAVLFPEAVIGHISLEFLTQDLLNFSFVFQNPSLLGLSFLCTILPYFLILYTALIWPRNALKHDLWASIFSLIEPLMGLYLGYFVWQEAIRLDYIVFTTLFLIATIIIRYFHEAHNTHKVALLIRLKHGGYVKVRNKLRQMKEVDQILVLAGNYTLMIYLTLHTNDRLVRIVQELKQSEFIDNITYGFVTPRY